jgi:hypothetical protein
LDRRGGRSCGPLVEIDIRSERRDEMKGSGCAGGLGRDSSLIPALLEKGGADRRESGKL